MAGQLIPVDPNSPEAKALNAQVPDYGAAGHGNAVNSDVRGQPTNQAQELFLLQYRAAGGWDPHAPQGSIRHPYNMFPQSPDPLHSTMQTGDYFVDRDGRLKQIAADERSGGNRYVVTMGAPTNTEGKVGLLEDAGRSVLPGVGQGVAGTVGGPGDLINLWPHLLERGVGAAQDMTGDNLGVPYVGKRGPIEEVGLDPSQPLGLRGRRAGFADDLNYAHLNGLPTSGDINTGLQEQFGVYHTPQHWTGRLAQTTGTMAPAALFPGSLAARAGRVIIPSLLDEAAGEATLGTPAEPYARFGGALLGGGVQGGLEGLAAQPSRVLGNATRGLTEEQLLQIEALRNRATSAGIDLSTPEAVQEVTNGATGLGRLQRLTENFQHTAPGWQGFYAARPDRIRAAVANLVDRLDLGQAPPGMTGLDAQSAAVAAQRAANGERQALAGPHYRAADAEEVDRDAMGGILRGVDDQIAGDQTGLLGPVHQRFRDSFANGDQPIVNIGNLSTARNYWRELTDLPPVGPDALTKYQSGLLGGHLDLVDALLRRNPNRVLGDQAYAAASRGVVDPLNAGPTGRIAQTDSLPEQTAALYPRNPNLGQAEETAAALQAIGEQNPDIVAALTRQHIGQTFNQSTRDLTQGANQYGGARFISDLLGNQEQSRTLMGGLDVLDPGGGARQELTDLAEILRATGRRERPGSMTSFNDADREALSVSPGPLNILSNPLQYGEHLKTAAGMALFRRNATELANLLRDPDTMRILEMARTNRSNMARSAAMAATPALLQLEAEQ